MSRSLFDPSVVKMIRLRVDDASDRSWISYFSQRIEAAFKVPIVIERVASSEPVPKAFEALMMLEKVLSTSAEPWLAASSRQKYEHPVASRRARDIIVLNFADTPLEKPKGTVLQARFDGALGLLAAADAVMDGRSPLIQIEVGQSGMAVASGIASLEAASSTGEAMTAIVSRVVTLFVRALTVSETEAAAVSVAAGGRRIDARRVTKTALLSLARRAARAAYDLCFRTSHWRIGWRLTDVGVLERGNLSGARWQILADPGTHFYADPFPIQRDGRRIIYFEDLDHRVGKGIISRVEIYPDGRTGPVVPVLEEPWHLSYPFLIEHNGSLYMVPESSTAGNVAIYRCLDFPDRWELHSVLLNNIEAADATIVSNGGFQYMFCVTRDGIGGYSDTLSIFTSNDLLGDWRPHPANPLIVDPATARPAGRMVLRNGVLKRPVQDCRRGYGAALAIASVTRLDQEGFFQTIDHVIGPDLYWPGRKLHTLNHSGGLETIDGCIYRPKLDSLNRFVEPLYYPFHES